MGAFVPRSNEFHGRGVNLAVVSIVFTLVALGLVVARLAARSTTGRKLGSDDYAIVLSAIFSIGLTASNCLSVAHGVGKPMKTLGPVDIHLALQGFWAAQITYKFTINLTKTSICLLYLRIFPNPRFRRIVWVVMSYVILYALASIVATIFQCWPIERMWNRKVEGQCIDLTAFWYANATAYILGDIIILCLPMPVIRSLKLPRRQRYGLMLVFALGIFVCVTSILRATTLKAGSKNQDITFGTLNSTIWTVVESNTAIICACLPMLKSPLAALFPSLFPRGSASREYSYGSGRYYRHGRSADAARQCSLPGRKNGRQKGTESTQESSNTERVNLAKNSLDIYRDEGTGIDGEAVPMGLIAKTTHVDVKFNGKDRSASGSPAPTSPTYPQTPSEARLVDPGSAVIC